MPSGAGKGFALGKQMAGRTSSLTAGAE